MELEYKVTNNKYKTINQILKNEFNISTRLLSKLIRNKKILLNDNIVDTRSEVNINDTLKVLLDEPEDNSNIIPTKMNLNIIYEDDCMLIIDKSAGIAIHPSMRHFSDSLSNGVRFYFDEIGLKKKIRPVNRLDKDTSGLTIFAKNEYVLTPGRYVGIAEQEDDGEPFEEKMARLTKELSGLFAESHRLEQEIRERLGAIGYEI